MPPHDQALPPTGATATAAGAASIAAVTSTSFENPRGLEDQEKMVNGARVSRLGSPLIEEYDEFEEEEEEKGEGEKVVAEGPIHPSSPTAPPPQQPMTESDPSTIHRSSSMGSDHGGVGYQGAPCSSEGVALMPLSSSGIIATAEDAFFPPGEVGAKLGLGLGLGEVCAGSTPFIYMYIYICIYEIFHIYTCFIYMYVYVSLADEHHCVHIYI